MGQGSKGAATTTSAKIILRRRCLTFRPELFIRCTRSRLLARDCLTVYLSFSRSNSFPPPLCLSPSPAPALVAAVH